MLAPDVARNVWITDHFGRKRPERVAELWAGFPDEVAEMFHSLAMRRGAQRRQRDVIQAVSDLSRLQLHADAWTPHHELYEVALHSVAAACRTVLATDGVLNTETEARIAGLCLEDLDLAVRYECSRYTRPGGATPLEVARGVVDTSHAVIPIADGAFTGWYRLGAIESQLAFREDGARDLSGLATAAQGICVSSGRDSSSWPFANAPIDGWRTEPVSWVPASFNGPLVGIYYSRHWLGHIRLLAPQPFLVTLCGLTPCRDLGPLTFVDEHEQPAMAARQWRFRSTDGDDLANERPQLAGCDLVIRADVYERIAEYLGRALRVEWWSRLEEMPSPDPASPPCRTSSA